MTLTKLALAVLGTIGLTAGTVLAVSEPTAAPLPVTLSQVSKAACPGSTCASEKCSTKACAFSATTVPVSACTAETCSAEKCSADKCIAGKCTAPPEQSEPIAAEVAESIVIQQSAFTDEAGRCCSKQCKSSFDADGICRKHFVGTSKSGCTVTGNLTLTTATSDSCDKHSCAGSTCNASACSKLNSCSAAECETAACDGTCNSECEGKCASECETSVAAKKATRRITLGIGLSNGGPIVHVSTGTNEEPGTGNRNGCSAASSVGRVLLSLISGQASDADCCKADHELAATACEAKPACVSLGCPVAACATSSCDRCETCECEACQCEDTECDAPAKQAATHADQQNQYEVELYGDGHHYIIRRSAIRYFDGVDRIASQSAPCPHPMLGDYPPLRVPNFDEQPVKWHPPFRIAGVAVDRPNYLPSGLPPVIISEGEDESHRNYDSVHMHHHTNGSEGPGRVRVMHDPINVYSEFQPRPQIASPSPRIRLSGFAAPVAAPQPPRTISPRLEGTWTRSSAAAPSFAFQNGRVSGNLTATTGFRIDPDGNSKEEKTTFRFSGSCTVTTDGQFVGVIDDVEVTRKDAFGNVHGTPMSARRLIDQPFAARFVIDGGSLIIKDIRCSGISPGIDQEETSTDLLQYVRMNCCGRYERGDE